MPLNISGPVSFVNGRATSPAAQQLLDAGFDPNSGGGYGAFVAAYNARDQQQPQQPVPPITAAVQKQVDPTQAARDAADKAGLDQAAQNAVTNAPAPSLPPPALQTTPLMAALGLQPTVELANKYKYNPPWRV